MLIIKSLIDIEIINFKASKKRKCSFVDFKQAFDTMERGWGGVRGGGGGGFGLNYNRITTG